MKDSEMKNNRKAFTYSKAQLLLTACIFIICIAFVIFLYLSGSINDTYDTAAIVTLITVSGAIFGSNLCWYSKKAASENQYKLRMSLFADSSKVRLEYNEKMMQLMKKYNMTQSDLDQIDSTGDMDEMMDASLQDTVSSIDTARDQADSENTLESFSNL